MCLLNEITLGHLKYDLIPLRIVNTLPATHKPFGCYTLGLVMKTLFRSSVTQRIIVYIFSIQFGTICAWQVAGFNFLPRSGAMLQ